VAVAEPALEAAVVAGTAASEEARPAPAAAVPEAASAEAGAAPAASAASAAAGAGGAAGGPAVAALAAGADGGGGDDGDDDDEKEEEEEDDDDSSEPFAVLDAGLVPNDHAFLLAGGVGGGGQPGGAAPANRSWSRRVHREWRQLRRGLPADGSVRVQAYEDRLDVLRACVCGPEATPYARALFLFDIHLPPSYPASPPSVFFWSFGERMNPNLYENGKVCLSLLGTWSGRTQEMWSAETSNLLQVLISIQGLVLVREPYYNEPGYEAERGTRRGEASSRQYDEGARLLSLQSAARLLQSPPQRAERWVRAHFAVHARAILRDAEALLAGRITCNGTPVPTRGGDGGGDGNGAAAAPGASTEVRASGDSGISRGMRIALNSLLPKLRAQFEVVAPLSSCEDACTKN
jgi:ubiquitin-protein ligase